MTDIHSCSYYCDRPECIKAQRDELRERLAQPEQEEKSSTAGYVKKIESLIAERDELRERLAQPEQEAQTATYTCGVCGVSMQMEQPEQEPAPVQQEPAIQASIRRTSMGGLVGNVYWVNDRLAEGYYTLYTSSPPQRKPLTDEEIRHFWREATMKPKYTSEFVKDFARAIEAAHGIKVEA